MASTAPAAATSSTSAAADPSPAPIVPVQEIEEPAVVEAETSEDSDSAFGDDTESYTTSLRSLVTNFEYENGRRYHGFKKGNSYYLPNDEEENDRLDLYHHLVTICLGGKLHLAPIGENPQHILDVGTGTGIWAILMGDAYPSAQIIGNDLSPIQPSLVPPNVSFEIDDVEDDWIYSRRFDFIHSRYMNGSLKSYPRLISQAYEFLKPGGWFEIIDFDISFYTTDGSMAEDSILHQWTHEIKEGIRDLGREPEPGPRLKEWVSTHEPRFQNIHHRRIPFPVGSWPKDKSMKERGMLDLVQFLDGLEGFSLRILSMRGWKHEEIQVMLAKCRDDLKSNKIHKLHDMHVVYAQKPL